MRTPYTPHPPLHYLSSGTASLPTYSFNTSPSTGMFMPLFGTIAFSTLGTQRARINNAGLRVEGGHDIHLRDGDIQIGNSDIYLNAASNGVLGVGQTAGAVDGDVQAANFLPSVGLTLPSYTVAGLPTHSAGRLVYCTDETGGAVPVFSDGTSWRRVTDRVVAS